MSKEKNIVTLEDLLTRFDNQNKKFIKELEVEESAERIETVDSIINDIKAQKEHAKQQKNKFITEIKFGLGEQIKENPTTIIKHTKPWYVKLKDWLKNIFTKF